MKILIVWNYKKYFYGLLFIEHFENWKDLLNTEFYIGWFLVGFIDCFRGVRIIFRIFSPW